ncbi:MAG TPA: sugar phosphate isomerase/epimerase family protein [Bacteroidales bacterium]|jgi:sugar phosphate isomerase/epimerase|nr:TIM barrel protein [Bacteroidales bacterium]HNR41763.1 sugar phosphate isomerase/epimerase family protein [Bacteroidales bacterium]HPM17895.1 sugar phosphate isomerase/epimerase family protein [Bacteroidales bacterium]HQG76472.1 sugar phosphate isomerase/epimerase family protein [Bacteroidales bacterium]
MKLGFVSAIVPELSFEELIDFASAMEFQCVEVCCWPLGKAERRYAGVTHIDVDTLDDQRCAVINNHLKVKGVEISALGYYPNPLDPDPARRNFYVSHIRKVIDASALLGINRINTFVGRDKNKSVEENFEIFQEVWKPVIQYAETKGVKVGIENCPMLFTADEWPGGNNLATTPAIWRRMFNMIPSASFGLNYDPSHLLWQQMDYVRPLYEFREKIFHVHFKDAKVYTDKLDEVGIMATPLEFHSPKLPGLGDIEWGRFISALNDIRYKGFACIEVEDKSFENSLEERKHAVVLSKRYLSSYM